MQINYNDKLLHDDSKPQAICITGATGYLGSRLVQSFFDKGHTIIALKHHEKTDYEFINNAQVKTYFTKSEKNWQKLFIEHKIDTIIHTAVAYGRNNEDITEIIDANIKFPCELLSLAIKHNVSNFINTDTILSHKINPYALTKYQFTQYLELYASKIRCINLKFDHFYGPNDKSNKFIAYLIENFKNNIPKLDLTEGSQYRDFIYIDDVINAYQCIFNVRHLLPLGFLYSYNVGSNSKITIKELVLKIQEKAGNTATKLNFGAIPYRQNELLDYEIDTSAIRLLGWSAQTSLDKGLDIIIKEEGNI